MTEPMPEQTGEPLDVDITFTPTEEGIEIAAVLGQSRVVIEHPWEEAEYAATLVQALPSILIAVQQQLDKQEEE